MYKHRDCDVQAVTMSSALNVLCIFVQQIQLQRIIKDHQAQLRVHFAGMALWHMWGFPRQERWWGMSQGSQTCPYHFAPVPARYWSLRMSQPTWKSHFANQHTEFPTLCLLFAPWAARSSHLSSSTQACAWEPMLAPPWFLAGVWGATLPDVPVLVLEEHLLPKREGSHPLGSVHWIILFPLEMDADFILGSLHLFIPQILVAPCLKFP